VVWSPGGVVDIFWLRHSIDRPQLPSIVNACCHTTRNRLVAFNVFRRARNDGNSITGARSCDMIKVTSHYFLTRSSKRWFTDTFISLLLFKNCRGVIIPSLNFAIERIFGKSNTIQYFSKASSWITFALLRHKTWHDVLYAYINACLCTQAFEVENAFSPGAFQG
jgi:hypothetical protein